jgi:hypothetical protein
MNERIILVLAKSRMKFQEIIGKPETLEEAIEQVKKDHARNEANLKEETWVDITTGKTHKANY